MDGEAAPKPGATVSGWSILAIIFGIVIFAVMAYVVFIWIIMNAP